MQHFKILERAWMKTWRYRALWIFGLFVALSAGGGGGRSSGSNAASQTMGQGFRGGVDLPDPLVGFLVTLVVIFIVLLIVAALIFGLFALVARYLGDSALMQLVDREEADGTTPMLADGFQFSWSTATLRLFAIDVVVGIPTAIISFVLILFSATPLLLWFTKDVGAGILGTVLAVGLFMFMLILIGLLGASIGVVSPYYRRRTVLAERGVFASIGEGISLVFRHLGDVLLMWLIMIVVNILGGLALTLAALLLILLVLLIVGLPVLLFGWLFSAVFNTSLGYVIGAVGTLPWFFGLVLLPSLLFQAVFEVFKSTVWTLTYRELLNMEPKLTIDTGESDGE